MIIYGDITKLNDIEAIVNASNGIGYMGGRVCVKELHKGVAESIQYVTKGAVEKLAKKECKAHHIFGYAPGEVFVTDAPNVDRSTYTNYEMGTTTMTYVTILMLARYFSVDFNTLLCYDLQTTD